MGPNDVVSSFSVSTNIFIPVWYQSLGMRLHKIVFPRVDDWLMGPSGFGTSHVLYSFSLHRVLSLWILLARFLTRQS